MISKKFNPKEIEQKWSKFWNEEKIYKFDENGEKPYIIDTPPPFTSGVPHMGHALWWTWNDIIARFKRMNGYDVLLPQGWDCHGLPTELKVEKEYGIKKDDKEEFIKKCNEWTEISIEKMKSKMIELGYSADWDYEYKTHTPEYIKFVQETLLKLYEKGLLKRVKHPVMWCTKCKTTLAKAEVGYKEVDGSLYYIKFPIKEGGHIQIATTRPELLPACVAIFVHPDDERYKDKVGKHAVVPFFDREVPIIANEDADMEFGTGAVYLCTYGDEMDIKWQKKYGLPEIDILNEDGTLNENAGMFKGLTTSDARKKILEELSLKGLLVKQERYKHNVLCHTERQTCMNPIEFIPKEQWAISAKEFNQKIIEMADEIKWSPEYMKTRLINWAQSMDWDWIISRQRVFGTPIPFYYCKDCGAVIPVKKEDLPVNPAIEKKIDRCPKCGSTNIVGEMDICDGWVDSSITPLIVSGYWKKSENWKKFYPSSLRQQGHDIIRTWAYYTMLRCYLETGERPWDEILINGMVLGPDGREMHKSLGNVIEPDEILEKHGADTIRMGLVLLGLYGKDAAFSWKDMEYCYKFLIKFWNIYRFSMMHLVGVTPSEPKEFNVVDKWILTKLSKVEKEVKRLIENYQFNVALTKIQTFIWHEFADYYIEFAKHRLYEDKDKSAIYTLYKVLLSSIKLLAPFAPFITEELYQNYFRSIVGKKSIHLTKWPEDNFEWDEKPGELLKDIVSYIRKYKTKNGMKMKDKIRKVIVNADIGLIKNEIMKIMNVDDVVEGHGSDKTDGGIEISVEN